MRSNGGCFEVNSTPRHTPHKPANWSNMVAATTHARFERTVVCLTYTSMSRVNIGLLLNSPKPSLNSSTTVTQSHAMGATNGITPPLLLIRSYYNSIAAEPLPEALWRTLMHSTANHPILGMAG